MPRPTLSVCIPSWNTRALLRECLATLGECCRAPHEIIVVDNASEDGSAEMVAADFSAVRLLVNAENRGYARATNQALEAARGRFVVLLNSDTAFSSDIFTPTVEFLEAHPRAGGAAPCLRRPSGARQRSWGRLPSLSTEVGRALLLDRVAGAIWEGDGGGSWRVDTLMGACLVLKRAALEEVGLLDEGFLYYGEDVDLCWRMKEAGWGLYILPGLEVTHHGAASSRRMRRRAWLNYYRSKCRLLRKHRGGPAVVGAKVIFGSEALVKGLLSCAWPTAGGRARAKEHFALLRQLGGF